MPVINKLRYFKIGQPAPSGSGFKGNVTAETIFGSGTSYFSYTSRYSKEDSGSLMDYTGRYGGIDENFTMSDQGKLDTDEKMEKFKQFGLEHLTDKSIVYEIILSLDSVDTANKSMLYSQKNYANVVDRVMPRYLKSIGFDPYNITWWQDFHPTNRTSTTPHPHIHLLFFETTPSGIYDDHYGKLPKKATTEFKRLFASEMIKRMDREEYRAILDGVNANRNTLKSNVEAIDFSKIKSVKELYAILPSTGRLQYNSSHMIPYRESIMNAVDDLLNSDELKDDWQTYTDSLSKYDELLNRQTLSDISTRSDQEIAKIKVEFANMILQYKKTYEEECQYDNVVAIRDEDGNKTGKSYKSNKIVSQRLANREDHAIHGLKKGMKRALNQHQRDVEDEINKFLHNSSNIYS